MITRFLANCFIVLQGKYEQNEEIFTFYFRHSIDIQCDVNIYCKNISLTQSKHNKAMFG